MIKIKGGKSKNLKALKSSLKKGASGDSYLQRVKADTTLTIRLLEEPENWIQFFEYFDEDRNMFLPQVEGVKVKSANKPVARYLVNAIDIDEAKVIPLVLAKTAVRQLVKFYEKFSTILDRDYEITRSGTGLETEYDVERTDPVKMNLKKYQLLDLPTLLESQLTMGLDKDEDDESEEDEDEDEVDEDEDEDNAPKKTTKRKGSMVNKPAKKKVKTKADEDEDEDEEEDEKPASKKKAVPAKKGKAKAKDEDDDEDDDEDEDEVVYKRSDLEEMSLAELKTIARGKGVEVKGLDEEELISAILGESSEDSDDESEEEEEEEEEVLTEADLKKMDLDELKALAKEYGIKIKKDIKKPALVKLLLESADEEDE